MSEYTTAVVAEVSVTTAVVVIVAVADVFVASGCAADSASPTMSGSRHDKLGRGHSTLSAADHYLRPDGPPLTLLLVGATQHAACPSGVGEGGRAIKP